MLKREFTILLTSVCTISAAGSMTMPESLKPAAAESIVFETDHFFVVVGTYGKGYVQLRYFGDHSAEKVVWKDTYNTYQYGDLLVSSDTVSMTRVQDFPDSPNYAMSYYYELDGDTKLVPVGNCMDDMEQKELTVTDKTYDGSGHWSIHLASDAGETYSYGLNPLLSDLGVNPVDFEIGAICTFAFYNGEAIIPLADEAILPVLPMTPAVLGDVNRDGDVSDEDARLLMDWLLGKPVTILGESADLDNNQQINAKDLSLLIQLLNHEPPSQKSFSVNLTLEPESDAPLTKLIVTADDWMMEYPAPEGGWTETTLIPIAIPVDYANITFDLMASSMIDPKYELPVNIKIYKECTGIGEQIRSDSETTLYPAFIRQGKIYYTTSIDLTYDDSSGTFSYT